MLFRSINTAKGEAIADAAEKLAAHEAKTIHITEQERNDWNTTKSRLDTFLGNDDLQDELDKLAGIQQWFETHGTEAEGYAAAITALEGRADALESEDDSLAGLISSLETKHDNFVTAQGVKDAAQDERMGTIESTHATDKAALQAEDLRLAGLISGLESTHSTDKAALQAEDLRLAGLISSLETKHDNFVTAQGVKDAAQDEKIAALETAKTENDTAHAGFTSSIEAINALLNGMSLASTAECAAVVTNAASN